MNGKKLFFSFLVLFFLMCEVKSYWLPSLRSLKLSRQLDEPDLLGEENNESSVVTTPIETKTTEDLFWTIHDINNATNATEEAIVSNENDSTEPEESTKIKVVNDDADLELNSAAMENKEASVKEDQLGNQNVLISDAVVKPSEEHVYEMNEKIVLQRNNCNLEIPIGESYDTRILIKFEPLRNAGSGKCYITLNCHEKSMLGIFLSNIHLYRNNAEGEHLKVIITNSGPDFVLKQYFGQSPYEPLVLTETHQAYVILHYNITTAIQNDEYSYFNLEAFTYHSNQNHVQHSHSYNHSYSVSSTHQKVENIFITTDEPFY